MNLCTGRSLEEQAIIPVFVLLSPHICTYHKPCDVWYLYVSYILVKPEVYGNHPPPYVLNEGMYGILHKSHKVFKASVIP
jgi:hypothetical protein